MSKNSCPSSTLPGTADLSLAAVRDGEARALVAAEVEEADDERGKEEEGLPQDLMEGDGKCEKA